MKIIIRNLFRTNHRKTWRKIINFFKLQRILFVNHHSCFSIHSFDQSLHKIILPNKQTDKKDSKNQNQSYKSNRETHYVFTIVNLIKINFDKHSKSITKTNRIKLCFSINRNENLLPIIFLIRWGFCFIARKLNLLT